VRIVGAAGSVELSEHSPLKRHFAFISCLKRNITSTTNPHISACFILSLYPGVYYVDTTGWLGSSDFTDGTHPNEQGSGKAAQALVSALRKIGLP
jgi:hypothetical protein